MTDLTDEEAARVVAKDGKGCGPAIAVRLAHALLQARASLAAQTALVETLMGALREAREKAHIMAHDEYDGVWSEQDFRDYTPLADAAIEAATTTPDPLAQANLRAKNAYMRGLLDSAQHLRSTIPDKPDGWEQIESMARMLDAMATREAARQIAEEQK